MRPVSLTPAERQRITDLAMKAMDLYRPRHVRECGSDVLGMLRSFDRFVSLGCSATVAANFVDSLGEAAAMLEDMTAEAPAGRAVVVSHA